MSALTEYRIEYTLQRKRPQDEDFIDIGFGSSGGSETPKAACHNIVSDVDNENWETEGDMPDPRDIKSDIEEARDW